MARPKKEGLDYFELDCHMDEKVRLIQAEFGLKGLAVIVLLFQRIYGEQGYYMVWDEDRSLLFLSDNGISSCDINLINEIVSACIRRNIFSQELYQKYHILTSSGIQKRYFNAVARRETVTVKKEYLLISVRKNMINVCNNSINVCNNSQRREEKSRVEKSREREKSKFPKGNLCRTDVQPIVDAWNKLSCYGIPSVSKLSTTSKRYKSLVARISEYGQDDVLRAIDKIKDSDFLKGIRSNWKITFDWFVLPNNFPKVLEGNYDNQSKSGERDILSEWRNA